MGAVVPGLHKAEGVQPPGFAAAKRQILHGEMVPLMVLIALPDTTRSVVTPPSLGKVCWGIAGSPALTQMQLLCIRTCHKPPKTPEAPPDSFVRPFTEALKAPHQGRCLGFPISLSLSVF